jgi:hypothetical protein
MPRSAAGEFFAGGGVTWIECFEVSIRRFLVVEMEGRRASLKPSSSSGDCGVALICTVAADREAIDKGLAAFGWMEACGGNGL